MSLPEFLVHFPTVQRIAAEYDLTLEWTENLLSYEAKAKRAVGGKLQPMTPDEREVAGLYLAFVFRKSKTPVYRPEKAETPRDAPIVKI